MSTVTLELAAEEVEQVQNSLRESLYFIQDLSESHHHPGDLIDWGKQVQVVGSILLKLRNANKKETENVSSKKKKSKQ